MRRPTVGEVVAGAFTVLGAAASVATLLQYANVPPEQAASALGGWFYRYAPLICLLGGFTLGASVSYMVTNWRCGRESDAAVEKAVREARAEMRAALEDAERRASEAEAARDEALSQKEERMAEEARLKREDALMERVRHMSMESKVFLVGLVERGDAGIVIDDYGLELYMDELQHEDLASWETSKDGTRWRVTRRGRDLAENHPELLDEARAEYEELMAEG
ncbi:MAG: hypothetical protein ACLUPX_01730 [Atopobiaceae bacterium]